MKTTRASIVSIGNELLSGSSVDTNSAYLSEKLLSIGIPTVAGYTVRDDCEAIAKALRAASEQADIVLTTGGLGPTDDDITRQAISKFCTRQLKLNESLVEQIEQFFARRGKEMPQRNRVQAYLPDGAEALNNEVGTAPGIMLIDGEKMLFAMPGVPVEMKLMFEKSVLPRLTELDGREVVAIRKLKCFGMGESSIAELLGDRMQRGRNPLVNTTVRDGVITLHITAAAKDQKQAGEMAKREQEELTGILRDVVFATEDITLAQAVGAKLTKLKKTVAAAESCTGGLVSKLLTDVPGSSNYFICGWVVYSNTAKITELGVEPEIIEKKGAVSEAVAAAIAAGARSQSSADYAIGITGIAGPGGATADKSVGLVYISLAKADETCVQKYTFSGDRDSIRKRAANAAINLLLRNI